MPSRASHLNMEKTWKYIKARRSDNIGVGAIKNNGILYHDDKTMAELLNHQFKSVFTMDYDTDHLPTMSRPKYPNIESITISIQGVEKLLDNINIHKASGPDKIPNIILKICSVEISPALANIFQQSLDIGTLPNDWRNTNISHIFINGSKHMASNYHPISLTSVCCKTFEHIICMHMLDQLENNKIVSPSQHGFRNGHSCESQLILTMNDIMQNFDSKQQTDLVILDFSKAFDTVPHKTLLFKRSKYGFTGNINKWIQSLLMHRRQQVIVEGESSKPFTVDSGEPQGSVLGPLLLLCHINNFPQRVISKVRLSTVQTNTFPT